ncbi:MAG: hypothetical protein RLZZ598_830 [Pseudomonadota bacterium]|jgi:poly-beta-1,6-N-acetyl-D-glucosamine biosynthesis protein PgaD
MSGMPNWPPLVGADHLPAWVRWRDVLLTLLAWLALLALLHHALDRLVDYFTEPYFEFTRFEAPDWQRFALKLRPFLISAGLLIGWMLLWALRRHRYLLTRGAQPAPTPLALTDHAAYWGLDAAEVATWRGLRLGVVGFNEQQRLSGVQDPTKIQL